MIVCDALTGMRRSELMGLQWGHKQLGGPDHAQG